jgi:hypothetical protein
LAEVYHLTFFIGSVPAATKELFRNNTLEPVRVDSSVERWTESLGDLEIQEALRAGLAAYVKSTR